MDWPWSHTVNYFSWIWNYHLLPIWQNKGIVNLLVLFSFNYLWRRFLIMVWVFLIIVISEIHETLGLFCIFIICFHHFCFSNFRFRTFRSKHACFLWIFLLSVLWTWRYPRRMQFVPGRFSVQTLTKRLKIVPSYTVCWFPAHHFNFIAIKSKT